MNEESGQTLAFTAVILVSFLGLCGMAVDAGHGYYAFERLKTSTNAATLAGAAGMPNTTTATANVKTFSSAAGEQNALGSMMSGVVATPTFSCSSTVTSKLHVACQTASGGSGGYNAISVCQTATVNTWFGALFGIKQFNIAACSMAAMKGGSNTPWNIALIIDTTKSMSDTDTSGQCSGQQVYCAVAGAQQLLENLTPCQTGQTCTSGGSTYVDDVSLYAFPPVLASTVGKDYCSPSSGDPTHEYYEVPSLTVPSPAWTYQIVPYSHDYKTSDGSGTTLNNSSNLVKALGYSASGCSGLQAPGGAGTYYAQAIYQAQSDLITQQHDNPGSQNAMIILTDGDATACATNAYTTGGACSTAADLVPSGANTLNGLTTNNKFSYTYPSALGECGQAVLAAQAATTAGTVVYTIGYNAETSGGCLTDKTYSATSAAANGGGAWGPNDQPCAALAAMASTASTFYSVDDAGCAATVELDFTTLTGIFNKIPTDFTAARLIPNGTT
ncbi:MAG: Tad domain-containing protein [Terracidiphilus sp.]